VEELELGTLKTKEGAAEVAVGLLLSDTGVAPKTKAGVAADSEAPNTKGRGAAVVVVGVKTNGGDAVVVTEAPNIGIVEVESSEAEVLEGFKVEITKLADVGMAG